MSGKGTAINEVAKDRLWRDYVGREENHQNYWAIESQFVKGSLSPEKRSIMRGNVETQGDFDANTLLGTSRGDANAQSLASTARSGLSGGTTKRSINTINMSNNPDAPSNLLLRQLQMTAAENAQSEAKQLETLQNFKNVYSTRAVNANAKNLPPMAPSSPTRVESLTPSGGSPTNGDANRQTPLSPNATHSNNPNHPLTRFSHIQKEPTLNNNYCSYYAGKAIGIHHYQYGPPANRCQDITAGACGGGSSSGYDSPSNIFTNSSSTMAQSRSMSQHGSPNATGRAGSGGRPANLPPLNTSLLQIGQTNAMSSTTARGPLSPNRTLVDNTFNSSRVYSEELEVEAGIVSPKRHYTETGLLHPNMGKRVASATGRRGYGQRILSTQTEAHAIRPSVELKERSQHGYRKW